MFLFKNILEYVDTLIYVVHLFPLHFYFYFTQEHKYDDFQEEWSVLYQK